MLFRLQNTSPTYKLHCAAVETTTQHGEVTQIRNQKMSSHEGEAFNTVSVNTGWHLLAFCILGSVVNGQAREH